MAGIVSLKTISHRLYCPNYHNSQNKQGNDLVVRMSNVRQELWTTDYHEYSKSYVSVTLKSSANNHVNNKIIKQSGCQKGQSRKTTYKFKVKYNHTMIRNVISKISECYARYLSSYSVSNSRRFKIARNSTIAPLSQSF